MRSDVSTKYIEKGLKIIDSAKERGIPLRMMGCCAVKVHCPKWRKFHETVMNRYATDIDFVALSKHKGEIRQLLQEFGYGMIKLMRPIYQRRIFEDEEGVHVDVFFDKLDMCHVIDLRDRLQVDYPTIPLADLLLEKMQIVKINEKDIKDVSILLLEHEAGNSEGETVNTSYIAKLLAKDWGFYYTMTTNLKLIRDRFLDHYKSILSEEERTNLSTKITGLLDRIEREPKSMSWKIRARVGPKKKWYKEVEEVEVGERKFEEELAKLLKKKEAK